MKLLVLGLSFIPMVVHAAIFGADDRSLVTSSSLYQDQAGATAIAVLNSNIVRKIPGKFDLDTVNLKTICPDEKLVSGPSLSYSCTGFLVAPDLLVTAGHCVYAVNNPGQIIQHETKKACEAFAWLFDYKVNTDGRVQTKDISDSKMYRCKQIIYGANREKMPFDDYALIQLDRPVKDRKPYKISTAPIGSKTEFKMLGFPLGTSMKLTTNGKLFFNNPIRQSFITSLDAFEGNSGSPVMNEKNEIVGILVGGTPSENFAFDSRFQCYRLNHCNDQGQNCLNPDKDTSKFSGFQRIGSEVQRITPILKLLKKVK